MKCKATWVWVAVATIFATVAQAQYSPSLMPPQVTAHPSTSASINGNGGAKNDVVAPPATATCSYTFTVPGNLNSYLSFCVSVNGNIVSLQSPNGFDYIAQGGIGEGYGICDASTNASYYDWAYADSGNWNAPVLVSNTTAAVKIARTTTDGLWTLTQTIAKQTGVQPYAKVTMAIRNNSTVEKTAYLTRYADVDPGAAPNTDTVYNESFDSTQYNVWGYAPLNAPVGGVSIGLGLKEIGGPNPYVPYGFNGLAMNTSTGPDPCNPVANYAGYQASVDGSIAMVWTLTIPARKSTTVAAKYETF